MEYPYIKNITHEKVQTLTSLVNAEDGQIVSKTLAQNEGGQRYPGSHSQRARRSPPTIPPAMRW